MSETVRIAEQLRRAFDGGAWHGPAVLEAIGDVTAAEASARPVSGGHSIWELALHIGSCEAYVGRCVEAKGIVETSDAEDWPSHDDASPAAWEKARLALGDGNLRLRKAIGALDLARLQETVPGKGYDFYVMLHGIVQHDLYHAGQISLLKRALRPGAR